MDRLETGIDIAKMIFDIIFTFQYGQIRNFLTLYFYTAFLRIYIPVWIDQKP